MHLVLLRSSTEESLGPSENESLFAIIWTAACAVSIILFGRLSDKFGRRYFMLGASGVGVLGGECRRSEAFCEFCICLSIPSGIIAATAHNMNTLIGANVFLGLSGGVQ